MEIVMRLTDNEQAALGVDAETLTRWYVTTVRALVMLRTGEHPVAEWHQLLSDLDHGLMPHAAGIRDAVIRAHYDAGGSVGDLALAMGVSRSTAQSRRAVVLSHSPASGEVWACESVHQDPRS